LIETHVNLAITYITVMSVALLIGLLGNSLILASTCLPGSINRVGKEFIVNLALADMCVAGIADPMCILGKVFIQTNCKYYRYVSFYKRW